jgi:3-hydroxyisobutyrate dehydrogenase-like beta-hydroxyacid dehydrogenase
MAERLLSQGFPMVVHNRTAAKADGIVARGARLAPNPGEAAVAAEIVITMVSDGAALREVALGKRGILSGLSAGNVHVDMSTVDPETTAVLEATYRQQDRFFLHAPVLGSRRAAAEGSLLIFAGGPRQGYERCADVFAALGKKSWHWDDVTQATRMKLACNLLLAGMMVVFVEALIFAGKSGIDPFDLMEVVSLSALAAPNFQNKGRTISQRNFSPNFYSSHMLKDLDLILSSAEKMQVLLPATQAVREQYRTAVSRGFGMEDYSAVVKVLEEAAGCIVGQAAASSAG